MPACRSCGAKAAQRAPVRRDPAVGLIMNNVRIAGRELFLDNSEVGQDIQSYAFPRPDSSWAGRSRRAWVFFGLGIGSGYGESASGGRHFHLLGVPDVEFWRGHHDCGGWQAARRGKPGAHVIRRTRKRAGRRYYPVGLVADDRANHTSDGPGEFDVRFERAHSILGGRYGLRQGRLPWASERGDLEQPFWNERLSLVDAWRGFFVRGQRVYFGDGELCVHLQLNATDGFGCARMA